MTAIKISPPSPLEYLSNFIGKFYNNIEPFLQEKDFEAANVSVGDLICRHETYTKNLDLLTLSDEGTVNGAYYCAVAQLRTFFDFYREGNLSERIAKIIMLMAKRNIAEIEIILSGNPEYESQRDRRN